MDYHMIIASQGVVRQAAHNRTLDADEFYETYGFDYFSHVRKLMKFLMKVVSRTPVFRSGLTMQKPNLTSNV